MTSTINSNANFNPIPNHYPNPKPNHYTNPHPNNKRQYQLQLETWGGKLLD